MMISKFTLVGMAANKTKRLLGKKYIADFGVIVIIGNGDKLDIKFLWTNCVLMLLWRDIFNMGMHANGIKNSK